MKYPINLDNEPRLMLHDGIAQYGYGTTLVLVLILSTIVELSLGSRMFYGTHPSITLVTCLLPSLAYLDDLPA